MKRRHMGLLFLILAVGTFFRFYHITETPPGLYPDEAMNGTNALQALESGNFRAYYVDNNGREGLFINLQALAIWFLGNEAWVLRAVSAFFGVLAVLAIYFLARELFRNSRGEIIALLSSFFLATSYWHITLSRIGFRAITTPAFSILAFYFLFRGMRRGSMLDFALSGIMLGLGLNGYIAFRFIPFAFAVPILIGLWRWWREQASGTEERVFPSQFSSPTTPTPPSENREEKTPLTCFPCATILIGIFVITACTPLILYFTEHPEDFATRTGQVSVFADEHPLRAFALSNIKTIGMLTVFGDCNPRHNFPCLPVLHPLVAIAFLYGLFAMIKKEDKLIQATLIAWLLFMTLPATLTREGMPHALRSIGMIPPVMLIAGFGAYALWEKFGTMWNKKLASRVALLLLAVIPITTGYLYFGIWASSPATASAFSQDLSELAIYARSLPKETIKYLIIELDYDGLPVSAQSVVYLTNTATPHSRQERNVAYLPRVDTVRRITLGERPAIIGFVAFHNNALEQEIERAFPSLVKETHGGFTVYTYNPN